MSPMNRDWYHPLISGYHQVVRTLLREVLDARPNQWRLAADTVARFYVAPRDMQLKQEVWHGLPTERIVRSSRQPGSPDILWIHGGGFAFGSPRTHRAGAAALAKATGRAVRLIDYPLAPEHPYPEALNALSEIKEPSPLDIVGDSAGGNLALSWALRRGCGDRLILLSPWLDLRVDGPSAQQNSAQHSVFDREDLREYAGLYLAGHPATHPDCSPILAADDALRSLGAVLLDSSKSEMLHADAAALASRAEALGLDLTWVQEEGSHHGWQLFPDVLPEAQRSVARMTDFLSLA